MSAIPPIAPVDRVRMNVTAQATFHPIPDDAGMDLLVDAVLWAAESKPWNRLGGLLGRICGAIGWSIGCGVRSLLVSVGVRVAQLAAGQPAVVESRWQRYGPAANPGCNGGRLTAVEPSETVYR